MNLTSCKSNEEEETETSTTLTIEQGKNELEDNTLELLDKVENFKNNSALNEIIELAEYLSTESALKSSSFQKKTLNTLSNISEIKTSSNNFLIFNAKQATTILSESSLIDDFNDEKGIYDWNPETEEFDKTGDSDDIIYNIAYNNGKTAVFSFTDFNTTYVGSDNDEELPTLAKANLKINNNTVFSQDFSATFQNGQLIPKKIDNKTTIGDFSFVTSHTNSNNSTIQQNFEFKLSNDVIMGFNLSTKGNFSNDLDGDVEDVLDNMTMSFQFLNATLSMSAKDDGFDSDKELSIDEQISLLNSNMTAELSINNKSIAKSIFYKDQDIYTNYMYNSNTQQWEEVEVSEDIVNVKFLFEDGTTSDFDTYFDGSFTSLEDKFETVFEAYEDLFSDI
jgi:hypothetical protein